MNASPNELHLDEPVLHQCDEVNASPNKPHLDDQCEDENKELDEPAWHQCESEA